VLLNQLPLPDLPETLITSLVFLPRVHPITVGHIFNLICTAILFGKPDKAALADSVIDFL
jgi:hypothetical protein